MHFFPSARLAAASDAVAIVAFVVVGLLSHHGAVSGDDFAHDALPLLGGWLGIALLVRLYSRPAAWRLATTWLVGITAGVAVRAAILGHTHVGKEAAFLGVALSFTLVFVSATRLAAAFARAISREGRTARL